MDQPNVLLAKAAARLNAHGYTDMAQDLLQLSRRWTPESERQLIDDTSSPAFIQLQQESLHDA